MFDTVNEELKWKYDFTTLLGEKTKIKGLVTYGKGSKIKHLVVD